MMELAFGYSPRARNRLGPNRSFSGWLKAGIHAPEPIGLINLIVNDPNKNFMHAINSKL